MRSGGNGGGLPGGLRGRLAVLGVNQVGLEQGVDEGCLSQPSLAYNHSPKKLSFSFNSALQIRHKIKKEKKKK